MLFNKFGGGGGTANKLVNASGDIIADLEKAGSGQVEVIGGLGDSTADKVLEGATFTSEIGVKKAGSLPDVTPEVNEQTPLVTQILESLVGKVTLANATADKILEGYSAYVGQQLVNGTLPIEKMQIDYGTLTAIANGESIATVNHSLKKSPSYIVLLPKSVIHHTNVFLANIYGNTCLIDDSNYKQIVVYVSNNIMTTERIINPTAYEITYDDYTITFNAGTAQPLRGSYYWIALA